MDVGTQVGALSCGVLILQGGGHHLKLGVSVLKATNLLGMGVQLQARPKEGSDNRDWVQCRCWV